MASPEMWQTWQKWEGHVYTSSPTPVLAAFGTSLRNEWSPHAQHLVKPLQAHACTSQSGWLLKVLNAAENQMQIFGMRVAAESSASLDNTDAQRRGLLEDFEILPGSLNSLEAFVVHVVATAAHLALVDVLLHQAYLSADGAHALAYPTLRAVPAGHCQYQPDTDPLSSTQATKTMSLSHRGVMLKILKRASLSILCTSAGNGARAQICVQHR